MDTTTAVKHMYVSTQSIANVPSRYFKQTQTLTHPSILICLDSVTQCVVHH